MLLLLAFLWEGNSTKYYSCTGLSYFQSIFSDYFCGFKHNIIAMKTVIRPVGQCETGRNKTRPLSAPVLDSWPQIQGAEFRCVFRFWISHKEVSHKYLNTAQTVRHELLTAGVTVWPVKNQTMLISPQRIPQVTAFWRVKCAHPFTTWRRAAKLGGNCQHK